MKPANTIPLLACLLLGGFASAADSITLRPQAIAAKTLADVAILDGPAAEALAETDVAACISTVGPDRSIALDGIREILEKNPRINWGRLTLSGSKCVIREVREDPASARPSPTASTADPTDVPSTSGDTIRDLVSARIAANLRVDSADLRLSFDEKAASLLNTPIAGRTADIQLVGSSDRQLVSVKLFENNSISVQENVRANVTIRRTVAVATAAIHRSQPLSAASFVTEERWLPASAQPAEVGSLAGRAARVAIRAGAVIEETDTEHPVVIKKGDLVDVHCLSGSIHLKIVARALEPAKVGETARFQATDSKRTFIARADGPNRAVTLAADAAPTAESPRAVETLPPADPRRTREKTTRGNRYADLAEKPLDPPSIPRTNPR